MSAAITLNLAVDGLLYAMPGEGVIWTPVAGWETDSETGKRRPTGPQQRDRDGLPLWETTLIGYAPRFETREMVSVTLRLASATQPAEDALAMTPVVIGASA